ncbi:MAG: hypothetical protein WCT44_00395 [Candidatus Paceibacterota bacterium]
MYTFIKRVIKFFDKLEDRVRGFLSHYPILYAILGGIGVVLFWRGVWHIADELNLGSIASMIIGSVVLLITGVFVSEFIGSKIIMSGIAGEEKITEKEEEKLETEETQLKSLQNTLSRLEKKLDHIDSEIEEK